MDEEVNGQGDNVNTEVESINNDSVNTDSTAVTAPTVESSVNPNWNEALELLPDEFLKNKLTPVFKKWDDNNNSRYEKVQQEYAPYKALVENNVPFDQIQLAFRLRNEISENPQVVFERLASHLGYDITKLNGEQSQGLEEDSNEDPLDPRIAEMQRVQEMQNAYLAQQYQKEQQIEAQRQEQAMYQETVAEFNKLTETYGNFDRNRAVQFAIWESEKTGGEVNLEQGVKAMLEFTGQAIKSSANSTAPDVFSGTGGMPSGQVDTSKMSESELEKYVVARMKAMNGG
jgi:hypothetical protein